MWPIKKTAKEAEIQWRWFRMSLSRHLCHFGQCRQSFWVVTWPVYDHLEFKAKIGQKWPKRAPNDRNWPECLKSDIAIIASPFQYWGHAFASPSNVSSWDLVKSRSNLISSVYFYCIVLIFCTINHRQLEYIWSWQYMQYMELPSLTVGEVPKRSESNTW